MSDAAVSAPVATPVAEAPPSEHVGKKYIADSDLTAGLDDADFDSAPKPGNDPQELLDLANGKLPAKSKLQEPRGDNEPVEEEEDDCEAKEQEAEEAEDDPLPKGKGTKENPLSVKDLPEDRFVKVKVDGEEHTVDLRDAVNGQASLRAMPLARGGVGSELVASLAALPPEEVLTALVGDRVPPPASPSLTPITAPVQAPRLAGHLHTTDGLSWHGRWRIIIDGVASDWETAGETAAAVAAAGIDKAADALGRHFANPAVFGGGVASLELAVQGIASPNDYGRVFSHLRGLDNVTSIGVKRVSGNAVLFLLSARGGLPAVAENLRLTSVLLPVAEQPGTYTLAGR